MDPNAMNDYASISFWHEGLPDSLEPRPQLREAKDVDVAIVGAGFSGLWTAYYLSTLKADVRVAIVESEVAGFGASGRNGGWCLGLLSGIEALLASPERRPAGIALMRAVYDAIDEVGRVSRTEGIDCHFQKGGTIRVATTPWQLGALKHRQNEFAGWGFGPEDYRLLTPEECATHVRVPMALGGLFSPHCAALHPARLARGLASAVDRRGVQVFERSPATTIAPGRVVTRHGELRAKYVIRATEAYTARLAGLGTQVVPLHTFMIATEPLPEAVWNEIGLNDRQTFADGRRIITYGQKTADGRIAFGGSAHYRYGSAIEDRFRADDPHFKEVELALLRLFPILKGVAITHRWGGAIGVPRNWRPSLGLDRSSGMGWLGGYVGEGVAATNLAGRTLAELIVGERTARSAMGWVDAASPAWEPEPLRWLAIKGLLALGGSADRTEERTGRSAQLRSRMFERFVGI
jgi:glycine/D-amino acid oxidase-like deaminating enzyme